MGGKKTVTCGPREGFTILKNEARTLHEQGLSQEKMAEFIWAIGLVFVLDVVQNWQGTFARRDFTRELGKACADLSQQMRYRVKVSHVSALWRGAGGAARGAESGGAGGEAPEGRRGEGGEIVSEAVRLGSFHCSSTGTGDR